MKETIIQIATPATPIFAVYNQRKDDCGKPTCPDDLWLSPCPVLALMENKEGDRFVSPLCLSADGIDEPFAGNFLGFASSPEEAANRYVEAPTRP